MNAKNKFIISKWEDVEDKYELKRIFSRYMSDNYKSLFEGKYFLISDKSASLEQSLFLDWKNCEEWLEQFGVEYEKDKPLDISGIIVLGDLEVKGPILNTCSDGCPSLFIDGNLSANNLLSGGTIISINGNGYIKGCTYGHYNHGELNIEKTLFTTLFIQEDHYMNVTKNKAKIIFSTFNDHLEEDEESGGYDFIIPKSIKKVLNEGIRKWTDIYKTVSSNEDVILESKIIKIKKTSSKRIKTKENFINAVHTKEIIEMSSVPKDILSDKELLLEMTKINPYVFNGLPNGWHLESKFMLAALECKNKNVFDYIFALENTDERNKVIKKAVEIDMENMQLIKAFYINKDVFNFAEKLYGQNQKWNIIKGQHQFDFWKYQDTDIYEDVINDPNSDDQYYNAFEYVWSCFWTEEFVIKCIENYGDISKIPEDLFTEKIYKAAAEMDQNKIPDFIKEKFKK